MSYDQSTYLWKLPCNPEDIISVLLKSDANASDEIALDIEKILRPFQVSDFVLVFHDMHFSQICHF